MPVLTCYLGPVQVFVPILLSATDVVLGLPHDEDPAADMSDQDSSPLLGIMPVFHKTREGVSCGPPRPDPCPAQGGVL